MKKQLDPHSQPYQHQRGNIGDNMLKAMVHDPLFHQRIERNKKGKGSYQRKAKHRKGYVHNGENPFKSRPQVYF